MIRADKIKVGEDEGHLTLEIDTDDGYHIVVDVHGIALEFFEEVRREIGPWYAEAMNAKHTRPQPDDGDGYELDDPKHPTFYERMVD